MRAAGLFSMRTVMDPLAIMPGPAGTHVGRIHGCDMSDTRAAGSMSISTVGAHGGMMASGSGGCGTGVGTGAGG
jgi:hypothetical protein